MVENKVIKYYKPPSMKSLEYWDKVQKFGLDSDEELKTFPVHKNICTIEKDFIENQLKSSLCCKSEMKQDNVRVASGDESIGFGQILQREWRRLQLWWIISHFCLFSINPNLSPNLNLTPTSSIIDQHEFFLFIIVFK